VLEAAGVRLDLTSGQVARCVNEIGVGFMFAPRHHGAMKHAIGPRREMGVRTLFNLLGPLTNPAGAPNQVVGVFAREWLQPLARVLGNLGSRHVLVVHSEDGMDEISVGAPTHIAELRHNDVLLYTVSPQQFGLSPAALSTLVVDDAQHSLAIIKDVLDGRPGAAGDVVALNGGAAIYVAGLADTLAGGIEKARAVLASGDARIKLDELVRLTNTFGGA
jgi:anthranilate phosphoribosyltransferase